MNKISYEDESPEQHARDYGIGGVDDSDSYPMPWWEKVIWSVTFLGIFAFLYELLHGNRAAMIFLVCAIVIIVGFLWKDTRP